MSKIILGRQALFALGDMIRQHCHFVDGFAVYDKPWSDNLIYEEFSKTTKCSKVSVTNLRHELVGDLAHARGGPLRTRELEEINKRLEALEQWAASRKMAPFIK